MENPREELPHLDCHDSGNTTPKPETRMSKPNATVTRVRQLLTEAKQQTGFLSHTPPGFVEPTAYSSKPAAVSSVLGLNSELLPSLLAADGVHVTHAPLAPVGAASMTITAGIAAASRVAQAGAHVIVRREADSAVPTGQAGIVAMQATIGRFATIEAAPFATVTDDADVAASDFPVERAALDWSQSIAKAVRFELPRSFQKSVGEDQLANELLLALTVGIARAADHVLLTAINAATPGAFSLAAAAARGLKFDDLRALVGTTGAGAVVGQDGALRVAGVSAELTADMAATIVGSFARSAVAVSEDVTLHIERRNTQGDLVATCWANFIPLVPDASAFWAVTA